MTAQRRAPRAWRACSRRRSARRCGRRGTRSRDDRRSPQRVAELSGGSADAAATVALLARSARGDRRRDAARRPRALARRLGRTARSTTTGEPGGRSSSHGRSAAVRRPTASAPAPTCSAGRPRGAVRGRALAGEAGSALGARPCSWTSVARGAQRHPAELATSGAASPSRRRARRAPDASRSETNVARRRPEGLRRSIARRLDRRRSGAGWSATSRIERRSRCCWSSSSTIERLRHAELRSRCSRLTRPASRRRSREELRPADSLTRETPGPLLAAGSRAPTLRGARRWSRGWRAPSRRGEPRRRPAGGRGRASPCVPTTGRRPRGWLRTRTSRCTPPRCAPRGCRGGSHPRAQGVPRLTRACGGGAQPAWRRRRALPRAVTGGAPSVGVFGTLPTTRVAMRTVSVDLRAPARRRRSGPSRRRWRRARGRSPARSGAWPR